MHDVVVAGLVNMENRILRFEIGGTGQIKYVWYATEEWQQRLSNSLGEVEIQENI